MPRWSPDGQWVATFSDRSGKMEIWKIRVDGSDLAQVTRNGGAGVVWSPDSARIAAVVPAGGGALSSAEIVPASRAV